MSLSLSSLLNPSPGGREAQDQQQQEGPAQQQPQHSQPPERRESLPPISYINSPEQHHVPLPQYTPPQRQSSFVKSQQEQAQTLLQLSRSNTSPPTQWNAHFAPDGSGMAGERMSSTAHNTAFELPPPPPSSGPRKMSSPTLDQYHVASRSPEQRRPSVVSSAFTLPPLQNVSSPERARRESVVGQQPHAVTRQSPSAPSQAAHDPEPVPEPSLAQQSSRDSDHTAVNHSDITSSAGPVTSSNALGISSVTREPVRRVPSPLIIKEEAAATPPNPSPVEARRPSIQPADPDPLTMKPVSLLRNESSIRQSPLRESSVPMPSTEDVAVESVPSKKRSVPSKSKKGTATSTKKAPSSKKRKIEAPRSATPSSRTSKPSTLKNSKDTPANSSPAPSQRSATAEPNDEEDEDMDDDDMDEDGDGGEYCLCHKPDTGTFMIGCDGTCDDWYHGKCVGIPEADKNLIDKYICPRCTTAGVGKTTWKRMCRRQGCRQPARVKGKSGKDGSKYCSDECGVLFFREMAANARGRESAAKNRSNRRKSTMIPTDVEGDLGARGGLLAPGEVRTLLDSSKTAGEFKRIGEGVLSPPATPDGKRDGSKEGSNLEDSTFSNTEKQALERIQTQKEEARQRHQLLKDRLKFVNLAKQAATRTAAEKELKAKDYCGFDPRLEWSEEQFHAWRQSPVGTQAFELDTLATEETVSGDAKGVHVEEDDEEELKVCDKRKCARHLEWAKLAMDDVRFEMGDNGDRMRALEGEERTIREGAVLRMGQGGLDGEGKVETHTKGLGIEVEDAKEAEGLQGEAMEVEAEAEPPVVNGEVEQQPEKMEVDGAVV